MRAYLHSARCCEFCNASLHAWWWRALGSLQLSSDAASQCCVFVLSRFGYDWSAISLRCECDVHCLDDWSIDVHNE
eukprot:5678399-Lingulodinium_polyedra.AAC.1